MSKSNMKCSSLTIIALLGLMLMALPVQAEVPSMITYQGVLSDVNGIPLNGDHSLDLAIYTQAQLGTAIWSETHTTVTVKRGVFNIMLGGFNPLDIPFDQTYWLGISLDGGAEMAPRVQFASVGTALMAKNVDSGAAVKSLNGARGDVELVIDGAPIPVVDNKISIPQDAYDLAIANETAIANITSGATGPRVKIVNFGTLGKNTRSVKVNPFGNSAWESCIVVAQVYHNGRWTGAGWSYYGQGTKGWSNAEGIVVQTGLGSLGTNSNLSGGGAGHTAGQILSASVRVLVYYIGPVS